MNTIDVDVVTYEVVRNRLTAIVAQQSAVLKNVSGSPLVTEANDCNTGVYLAGGDVVAMGPHNLFHSGSMETVVNHIIADCEDTIGINEGDMFITNDPYKGALHMPDVTMLEPVFYDGVRIAWVGTCAHVLDIGGMTPSSWSPDAREIYQEGLILPPTKIIEGGRTRHDVWNLILAASRLPANLGLDLKAMIAANTHAREGLLRLVGRYGVEVVTSVMSTMLDRSEAQVRARLAALPDGITRARSYFDHDGHKSGLSRIEVELRKTGEQLVFDYGQTAPQLPGFFNCTLSGLRGGVFASVLPVLAHDIPWNSGVMRAIEVTAPEGTIVNAKHPAPCGAATVGATTMVQNTAGNALAKLVSTDAEVRSEAMAGTTGGLMIFHIAGLNQYGEPYGGALTEVLAGGGGATCAANGVDYRGPHEILTGQFNNVEGEESVFPLLWLRRGANTDGGGAGRFHGGVSTSSTFTLHNTGGLHGVLAGHSMSMPSTAGLHGGMPGSTHHVSITRADGSDTVYTGSPGEIHLGAGDVVDWSFHGGGGWGDPLDAAADAVADDVRAARISEQAALDLYGVVLVDSVVDAAATEARRDSVRAVRRGWPRTATVDATPVSAADARRVGDHLLLGDDTYACDCGQVLAPAEENWKGYACRGELTAADLGAKVRLHPGLRADGYACPGCGALLGVEVRAADDAPLHELQLSAK
ncbi:hydantoinase B/oxoprolinase family protein [Mycolicibacterium confluentis]|uniref:5-oxoprolinase n=1 Tax=Mycolicibacterium confluentis TaxID=28047 RepID=A0A7I7XV46_9MYCO|nr:hydantoinase B/oxoprolinase family protein [Mycolicibacterium confluentis]MCV7322181.1 hydantoinase B/oxoprolinase family protein [Mycolicibacterium confluentis]ORV31500.1 5-oxoprolinase [Mycolicibacterium confluentis]BBZ32923.1 5-oxoprolinase [Mycolicibacterium confluentis]